MFLACSTEFTESLRRSLRRVADYAAEWSGSTSTKPLVEIWAGQLLGSGLFKHQAIRIRLTGFLSVGYDQRKEICGQGKDQLNFKPLSVLFAASERFVPVLNDTDYRWRIMSVLGGCDN